MRYARLLLLGVLALVGVLAQGQVAHAANFTVNSTADAVDAIPGNGLCATAGAVCTLRAAIQEANALAGADTITVPAGTYTLSIPGAGENANASGDLDITGDLTINGAGASTTTIHGGALDRVLHIVGVTVEISGATITNGPLYDQDGVGIFNSGWLTIDSSIVSGNIANGGHNGAGILNSGTLTLNSSTVSGNYSTFRGGGIYNTGGGTANLNNSTVSENFAGRGGGIYNDLTSHLTLNNSTVSGNTAPTIGGGILNNGAATLKNTIVANSPSSGNCGSEGDFPFTSADHNLSSDGSCGFTATGDLQNTDPMLGPLADNGGPTQTHALLAGSPAIDAGSPDCPPPAADQRGVARPQSVACDIGAFECSDAVNTDAALAAAGATRAVGVPLVGDGLGDACDGEDDNESGATTQDPGAAAAACPSGMVAVPVWADCVESYLGTNQLDNCAGSPPGPGGDANPSDINVDGSTNILDVFSMFPFWTLPVVAPPGRRHDLSADGSVNILDVFLTFPFWAQTCT